MNHPHADKKGLFYRIVENLGLVALSGVFIVSAIQVVLRFVFRNPLTWAEEIARLFEAWVIFLGSYIAMRKGTHVSVDFFVRLFPPVIQRIVQIAMNLLVVAFFSVLIHSTLGLMSAVKGTFSSAAGYPAPLFPAALLTGASAMLLETIIQLVQLIRGKNPHPAKNRPEMEESI